MDKKELRNYIVKDKNINGLTFDKYVERVESMTRAVLRRGPQILEKLMYSLD